MKTVIAIFFIVLSVSTIVAQDQNKNNVSFEKQGIMSNVQDKRRLIGINYNSWSINVNGGFNAPVGPFTPGYYSANANYITDPDFNHLDFNVRKMFNTKFGLMWTVGHDTFSSTGKSIPFTNSMFSTSFQGVINVHRALNFEEFTNTFGLQVHFGPGLSFLEDQNIRPVTNTYQPKKFLYDNIFSIVSGATVLIKLSDRFALNIDYTTSKNFSHHQNLDGRTKVNLDANRTGVVHTATVGATLYLGKKLKSADWYCENNSEN